MYLLMFNFLSGITVCFGRAMGKTRIKEQLLQSCLAVSTLL